MARQSESTLVERAPLDALGPSSSRPTKIDSELARPRRLRCSHRRVWYIRLVVVCMALLGALLVAELALRLLVVQEGKRLATYDAELGWRGRPNGTGVYARSEDNIWTPFRYNTLGFRDNDVLPKQSDGKRLLILGDSFVESLEVDFPQTFGAQIEKSIQARVPCWDVTLMGSQGYSTAQELIAFRKYRSLVDPDVVVLCFYCGNDFQDNLRQRFAYLDADRQLVLPASQVPWWMHQARRLQRWVYETSHVVYLLKNTIEGLTDVQLAPESKATVEQSEEYQQDITERLIVQLQREVIESGARLGIVCIPARDDLLTGDTSKVDWLIHLCTANQIPCIDLSPQLAIKHFFKVDFHLNATGHQVVAQTLEAFVLAPQLAGYKLGDMPAASNQAAWSE